MSGTPNSFQACRCGSSGRCRPDRPPAALVSRRRRFSSRGPRSASDRAGPVRTGRRARTGALRRPPASAAGFGAGPALARHHDACDRGRAAHLLPRRRPDALHAGPVPHGVAGRKRGPVPRVGRGGVHRAPRDGAPRAGTAHWARAGNPGRVDARRLVHPPHHGQRVRPGDAGARMNRRRPLPAPVPRAQGEALRAGVPAVPAAGAAGPAESPVARTGIPDRDAGRVARVRRALRRGRVGGCRPSRVGDAHLGGLGMGRGRAGGAPLGRSARCVREHRELHRGAARVRGAQARGARNPAVSLSGATMSITVLGVNHRTAPLEVRERFAHERGEVPGSLERVLAAGARGGVLLSTCNRTEFYLSEPDEAVPEAVWAILSERLGGGRSASEYGYTQRDRDAVRHLYRVSAGLDAMILGESQIQGQVRDAWETSKAQAGPVLHRLFQSALLVGARVRSETGLATGAASAPSAAVAVAARIFTRLAGRSALILGAGDMAELAATCLASEGVRVTLVANRTYERARAIAEQLGARALTLDEAWEHFADTDIVLSSTAAPHAVVTWDHVAPAVARRRGRPLCILDLGMPRDVEPAVAQLENVFLYDIDDLQAVAAQAAAERRRDIPAAESIVTEEVERFWAWYGGLVVVPVLKEFRERLDQVRATELERALRRLAHLSPEDRGEIEHFSQTLLNKFLHQPTIALKEAAQSGRGYGLLEALKRLFGLERRDDP